ncbi:hypothetical protein [Acidisphaera sp. L21]|uniref:hypothetical protein n=1 Tax=Acidisphaera sp. L21 TaxID=1641851 RepID=UPI00131B51BE|nr:hypothetical protein [Acidisphaera sp. L21]
MRTNATPSDETAQSPAAYREALAALVQVGTTVALMVGRAAEAETAIADGAMAQVAQGALPLATSLAEAIAADEAASAAADARRDSVRRVAIVAAAFSQVSRAIRRTIMLAERLDRGWARPIRADDRQAMTRRQIVRVVSDAIARRCVTGATADGGDAERLTEAWQERLDSLDRLDDIEGRPVEAIIREICRDLGLDAAAMLAEPPVARPVALRRGRTMPAHDVVGRDAVGRDAVGRDAVGRDAVSRASPGREHPD